jgi:hypothetical protein
MSAASEPLPRLADIEDDHLDLLDEAGAPRVLLESPQYHEDKAARTNQVRKQSCCRRVDTRSCALPRPPSTMWW